MLISILLVIVGVAILIGGGELLVRGASSFARAVGVSPMVVGLTVVALGTSAPELVVNALAAFRGNEAICGGNIVGSNILNILFVLGVTAIIFPLTTTADFVRREVPITVVVSAILLACAWNGELSRYEAAGFLVLMAAYVGLTIHIARLEREEVAREYAEAQEAGKTQHIAIDILLVVVGLAMLGGGAELFLRGSVDIAKRLGVSEPMIGLTLVAVGTSLPELAACVVAALRKHPGICLGNLIGSCIFNILAIGGTSGLITSLPFNEEMGRVHVPVMLGSTLLFWILVGRSNKVSRKDGMILLACYALYMTVTIASRA